MTKSGKRIYEIPGPLLYAFTWVSAGVTIFNLILLTANVVMRYGFGDPIKGTPEIVTMMMAWVAYSGMAYTLMTGKHMQLEALYEKLQGRAKHIACFFIYLLATVLFCFFIKASWDVFWKSWLIKEESVASVTIYVFIGKCGAFVGWVLLAVEAALMTIYSALGMANPDKYDPIGAYTEVPDDEAIAGLIKDQLEAQEAQAGGEEKGGEE